MIGVAVIPLLHLPSINRRQLCAIGLWEFSPKHGRIQDFHLGGGGAIGYVLQQEHYERGTEVTIGRGPGPA